MPKYVSTFANCTVIIDPGLEALYDGSGRRVRDAKKAQYAVFENHVFSTEDPEIIEKLEQCSSFTGQLENGQPTRQYISKADPVAPIVEEMDSLISQHGFAKAYEIMKEKAKAEALAESSEPATEPVAKEAKKGRKKKEENPIVDDVENDVELNAEDLLKED